MSSSAGVPDVDVLIIGAGISGIGSAVHLQRQRPSDTFVVVEEQDGFGGTWRTHTYPGARSDSDLHTYGFEFKPWTGPPIATAGEINEYLHEVINEHGIANHVRFGHRVTSLAWSSDDARWTVGCVDLATGASFSFRVRFVWMCQGYYEHAEGYTPDWQGLSSFAGQFIHAQRWPADTDLSGKKVVVIGSGATAATLIPNIANQCDHVTMLQRSPTFFFPARNQNELAEQLRALDVDPVWIHEIVRRRMILDADAFFKRCHDEPEAVRTELLALVTSLLPEGYDVATHFTPRYRPWQQRVAFVPDGDLFAAIRSGRASVVTDEIDQITPTGIALRSGEHLDADVIVAATGFHLKVWGGIDVSIDGQHIEASDTVTYRGAMFTGVPNLLWVFGYFRASWTLRVDLLGHFVCRLLDHLDARGVRSITPQLRTSDADMELGPWVEPDSFNPGYLQRLMHLLPKAGDRDEWRHTQNFVNDRSVFPEINLDDECFVLR